MATNGKLTLLVDVQAGQRLVPAAARAWKAMVAAAARDGVGLWITSGGAYADLAAQRVRYANRAKSPITVARPGYQTHGWGDRVDVGSFGRQYVNGLERERWLLANAHRFGFTREFGAADPNHFEHDGTVFSEPTVPTKRKRKTMTTNFVKASTGDKNGGEGSLWALAGDAGAPGPGNWTEFTRTPADSSVLDRGKRLADAHGNAIYLTDAEWDQYRKLYTTPAPAGTIVLDDATIAKFAQANAVAFFAEQKKPGN